MKRKNIYSAYPVNNFDKILSEIATDHECCALRLDLTTIN